MFKIRWISLLFPLLFLNFTPTQLQKDAVVKFVIGEVEAQSRQQTSWKELRINSTVSEGDRIKTALNSRVELNMPDGTQLKINENTIFDIDEIKIPEEDQEWLSLFGLEIYGPNLQNWSHHVRKDEWKVPARLLRFVVRQLR